MLRSLSSLGHFFLIRAALAILKLFQGLIHFKSNVLAAEKYPLCGLHYTWGFEKYGESQCVGE